MKTALVTGAAGFIGSHLTERLLREGYEVLGIDSYTDYYPREIKDANLAAARRNRKFKLIEGDINSMELIKPLQRAEFVFHLAAQPGVRPSWGRSFHRYVMDNIMATQTLLEACKGAKIRKFIYASSSSVYGDAEGLPTPEDAAPSPVSPYGATKLAAEHLCQLYQRNFGVPTVVLRYFTVYGPRQRPDMAFNKFILAIERGRAMEVLGDGSQSRDFTFVGDVVSGTCLAMDARPGSVYNVGSERTHRLSEAIGIIEGLLNKKARIRYAAGAEGDVKKTSADISRARKELGYEPRMKLADGLAQQVAWETARGRVPAGGDPKR